MVHDNLALPSLSSSSDYAGSDAPSETTLVLSDTSSSDVDVENDGRSSETNNSIQDVGQPINVPGTNTVHYRGYTYAWYHGEATKHYRSSVYRRTKCKAKLSVSSANDEVQGTHMSYCVPEIRRVPTGPTPVFVNWKQQMLLATDELGLRDVTLTPTEVWRTIRDQFYNDDNVIVQGATKKQVSGRLYRTRTKHFGREVFGRLESESLSDVKFSPGLKFFQFHFTYYEDEVLHRVIGLAHPQLMDRTKQRQCSVFIDATYRCVPVPFYQLVMIFNQISELYLPVWYVLTSGKTAQLYEHLLHYIYVASKKMLALAHVVCDFELAMIKAVKNQFPESRIVGCLFHFKQAIKRKMLKLKISTDKVDLAMRPGYIDKLTVIRRCEISSRGIHDVRAMIKRDCENENIVYSKINWQQFWKYFKKTWIIKFKPEWWNIYGLREDIVNRTNNPLERYNRTLNEAFLVTHQM